MKITEPELESSLIKKIDRLDNIESNKTAGLVVYNNNSFSVKSTDFLNINKVFDTDDLYALMHHLYKSEDNFISAYDTTIAQSNSTSTAPLMSSINNSQIFQASANILKAKIFNTFILLLDADGIVYKVDKSNPSIVDKLNVLNIIRMNFVYDDFTINSISDISYWDGCILVATEYNGVFCLSLTNKQYSLKIKEPNISSITVLGDDKTLAISKTTSAGNVVFYSLTDDTKTAIYNTLSKNYENTDEILSDGNYAYCLGKTYGVHQSNKMLHAWKLDSDKLEYNSIDKIVAKNPTDNSYNSKFVRFDNSNVYIIGEKKNNLFVWSYSKNTLNSTPEEYIFETGDTTYDSIKNFSYYNNKYYLILNNRVIVLDTDFKIIANYIMPISDDLTFIYDDHIYVMHKNICYLNLIPDQKYQKQVSFTIINDEVHCNNIDILIKTNCKDVATFTNEENNTTILPYFYAKITDNYHLIKLNSINMKHVTMHLSVTPDEVIDALVIHKNRVFYK